MKKLNFDVRRSCERILNSVHVVMWVFSEGTSSLCVSLLAGTFSSELTLPIKKILAQFTRILKMDVKFEVGPQVCTRSVIFMLKMFFP